MRRREEKRVEERWREAEWRKEDNDIDCIIPVGGERGVKRIRWKG